MQNSDFEFPWYSSLSTGIFEIDNQHGNIDILLQLFETSPLVDFNQLNDLQHAIKTHFSYEETLLGKMFPVEHQHEHTNILAYISESITHLQDKTLSKTTFTQILQTTLFEHISIFDQHLKKFLPSSP